MDRKLKVAILIIETAIGAFIGVLWLIFEAIGMKIPLWLLCSIEMLVVLTIIGTMVWLYWQKICSLSHIISQVYQARFRHRVHSDVSTRFEIRERTANDVQAEVDQLKKELEDLKADKAQHKNDTTIGSG